MRGIIFSGGCLLLLGLAAGCTGIGGGGKNDAGVPCTLYTDCPDNHDCVEGICTLVTGDCGNSICAGHTFCDTDQTCKSSTQKVCSSDADCGGDFICPPTAGVCMEPCTFDDECDVGFICNNGVSGCAECAFDSQCLDPLRPLCQSASGRCVACTGPGQCADGEHCDDGSANPQNVNTCQPGCLEAMDCAVGQRCEGAGSGIAGQCVECTVPTQSTDCTLSARPYCHPTTRQCVECTEGGQCPGGMVCNPEGTCVECLTDTHCPMGRVCDPGPSTCVSGCASSANCPPADALDQTVCDPNAGPFGACVECMIATDCNPGYKCTANACVEGCDSSATCPTDRPVCNLIADRCVECLRDQDCTNDLACDTASNTCVCLNIGETCTASAQCGNPPFDGFCAAVHRCVTRVECPSTGWRDISTQVCGQACSIVNNPDTCPSGYTCRRVEYEGGTNPNLQCVPNNSCL
ncbi:MAG: hypothetical protein P1V51_16335 [Deltaproteobacteria bacterium]|nr:hypothetical protein [Deltaproteobacteria bacterium]